MRKKKNTFVAILDMLGVQYTQSFSDQLFNEHPHKYNLYGLSKMLSDYGVENAATRIEDKENTLTNIQTPFVAQFSNDFVAVQKVDAENISFYWKGDHHVLTVVKFVEAWTGIVLLAETSETSIEPDYKKHRDTELIDALKRGLLIIALGLLSALVYIYNIYYTNLGISLLLLVNLAGMYIGYLLLQKQLHIESRYADKICSLFKQNDCNNVLESKAAKLFGVIGLSEIGFGYFSANMLLLLLSPAFITAIALINIFTLPFTFWSVWYQRVKAKQWCVLCLIVLALLWVICIINGLFGYLRLPELSDPALLNLIISGSLYVISILGINLLMPKINADKSIQSLRQSLNSMKADENVFTTLLKQQPFYETNDCDSVIRFCNPNSKLRLTVLSNPYCNPCAKMHKSIEDLLQQVNNDISVQYILSSFGETLNSTNKYLIAACMDANPASIGQILDDWFENGKALKDDYFKEFSLDMENPAIEIEFQKHEAWKTKTQLRSTPTLLVNGYQLPENYKVEDLRYFTESDFDI